MQNFTAEKWADKIALFIDNFGFLSGFFWHWTIALPSPTSHLAMLHSKIILSDPNRRVKVVLHRLFLILRPMQNLVYPKFYRPFLTKSAFLWGKLWKNWNCAVIFCHGRVLKGEITSPIYLSPTQAVQGDNPIVKKWEILVWKFAKKGHPEQCW